MSDAVTMSPPRIHGWLQAMRMQGEDRVWRGADETLRYVDALELSRDAAREALMEWLLAVKPGSVCDPFMGTGTTGVACAKLGVPFVGIERDQRYFEAACERLLKVSGEDVGPLFGEAA